MAWFGKKADEEKLIDLLKAIHNENALIRHIKATMLGPNFLFLLDFDERQLQEAQQNLKYQQDKVKLALDILKSRKKIEGWRKELSDTAIKMIEKGYPPIWRDIYEKAGLNPDDAYKEFTRE